MVAPPVTNLDPVQFAADPYPDLARMRRDAPITYVPQLDAVLLTRRDDIHTQEKRVEVFSSDQPGGLMTVLMGQNLMRRDGSEHMHQRRILFPALSPPTVATVWKPRFLEATQRVLESLKPLGRCDLVRDFAMPVSAEALKEITGLTTMTAAEMDGASQGMIDGCANYAGDTEVEAACHVATQRIDEHIDRQLGNPPEHSALAVQLAGGLSLDDTRANIKLIISGGQNEPRDAIAGTAWALLQHPDQLQLIHEGDAKWGQAFSEYVRLQSPIGMSPRRIAKRDTIQGITLEPDMRAFLMFSSAGRDEAHFDAPDAFEIQRKTGPSIPFGAGPHFCAGAAASRCLITEVALPLLFEALPNLQLDGDVRFHGWAFRGPVSVPVSWSA